jgi:branched-chain amino acid transport system permease protein
MNTYSPASSAPAGKARALPPVAPLIALVVMAAAPLFLSPYLTDLVQKVAIFAIFALSLELLVGTTGLVSLGHAAFFGIGAYVTALASPEDGPGALGRLLPLAMLGAGAYAVFVGVLSLRTKGVYFIMVTLAFAQMAYFVFHDTKIAGGSDGMFLMVRPIFQFGGTVLVDLELPQHRYYLALAALSATYGLLALLQRSRFGHALAGIRANEQRMRAAGYNTYLYKLAAFIVAAMLAGAAGFLMASKDGAVNPELLSWHESGAVLLMIILGGLGSLRGAVVGAAAFILLKEGLSSEDVMGPIAERWQLTLGMTMIAFVALLPNGLVSVPAQWRHRRKENKHGK